MACANVSQPLNSFRMVRLYVSSFKASFNVSAAGGGAYVVGIVSVAAWPVKGAALEPAGLLIGSGLAAAHSYVYGPTTSGPAVTTESSIRPSVVASSHDVFEKAVGETTG